MAEKRWIKRRDRAETGAIIAWAGVAMFILGVSGVLRVTFLGVVMMIVGLVVRIIAKKESAEERRSTDVSGSSNDDTSSSSEKRVLEIAKGAGGVVTPADVAVNSDIDLDRAEDVLKAMVDDGRLFGYRVPARAWGIAQLGHPDDVRTDERGSSCTRSGRDLSAHGLRDRPCESLAMAVGAG